jgi:hypothetical protein
MADLWTTWREPLSTIGTVVVALASLFAWFDARRRTAPKALLDLLSAEVDLLDKLGLLDGAARAEVSERLAAIRVARSSSGRSDVLKAVAIFVGAAGIAVSTIDSTVTENHAQFRWVVALLLALFAWTFILKARVRRAEAMVEVFKPFLAIAERQATEGEADALRTPSK